MRKFYCGAAWLIAAQAIAGTPDSGAVRLLQVARSEAPPALPRSASAVVPTWQQTASEDLHGPKVQLSAEILAQVRDGDYTCFVLDPYYSPTHAPVVACNPGYFTQPEFAPGRTLTVSGNMGSPMPRQIGTEVYDYPVIAGAILKPGSQRSSYPYSYHDPYYDPYYDPFWPHTPFYRGYWW